MAYYNENDPYAAQWLRNLIAAGHIAPGEVDERDIRDVRPDDLWSFKQAHFFAGIGVWSHALRSAGWDDDQPCWTGSCPCQPFSQAGKGAGFDDERHLWPAWLHLIQVCGPDTIFGEQVAGKNGLSWLDLVQADLEGLDYACGAVPAPAAGFGAPHVRERLYWVAHTNNEGLQRRDSGKLQERADQRATGPSSPPGRLAEPQSQQPHRNGEAWRGRSQPSNGSNISDAGPTNGFWKDADWLFCTDGKWRPVEPGTFPLADGVANRVGKLRAYGNAINAEQATEFIKVAMEYAP